VDRLKNVNFEVEENPKGQTSGLNTMSFKIKKMLVHREKLNKKAISWCYWCVVFGDIVFGVLGTLPCADR